MLRKAHLLNIMLDKIKDDKYKQKMWEYEGIHYDEEEKVEE